MQKKKKGGASAKSLKTQSGSDWKQKRSTWDNKKEARASLTTRRIGSFRQRNRFIGEGVGRGKKGGPTPKKKKKKKNPQGRALRGMACVQVSIGDLERAESLPVSMKLRFIRKRKKLQKSPASAGKTARRKKNGLGGCGGGMGALSGEKGFRGLDIYNQTKKKKKKKKKKAV